jgi:dolichol-phosphate mannosyltransferase
MEQMLKTISGSPHQLSFKRPECVIVLPCFNEEKNLESLIPAIDLALRRNFHYHIIAVNDGSTDGTAATLQRLSEKFPLEILEHENNAGLACALRTGLTVAITRTSDDAFIVTMDADNTHDPLLIPRMVDACRRGADVAISSRYVAEGGQIGVPLYRMLLSQGINLLIRIRTRSHVRDCTSGYRCYKANVLRKLLLSYNNHLVESEGFEVGLELLVKNINLSARVVEVPMVLNYKLKRGKSNLKIIATMLHYVRALMQIGRWNTTRLQSYFLDLDGS